MASYGIQNIWAIFKTKILIFHSKAKLDEKILVGKITHHLDREVRKILVKGIFHSERDRAETA